MGFTIEGLFVGHECNEYRNDDGSVDNRHVINVATGRNAYPVYMDDDFMAEDIDGVELGSMIKISCRVYATKQGRVMCVDGKVI